MQVPGCVPCAPELAGSLGGSALLPGQPSHHVPRLNNCMSRRFLFVHIQQPKWDVEKEGFSLDMSFTCRLLVLKSFGFLCFFVCLFPPTHLAVQALKVVPFTCQYLLRSVPSCNFYSLFSLHPVAFDIEPSSPLKQPKSIPPVPLSWPYCIPVHSPETQPLVS